MFVREGGLVVAFGGPVVRSRSAALDIARVLSSCPQVVFGDGLPMRERLATLASSLARAAASERAFSDT